MAKGKPRSQTSKEQVSRTMIRTAAERSRKARGYDVLLQLVREGIACGGSTRQFLRWVERAKFIIANEPAPAQETIGEENPSCWDCPPVGYPTDKTRCAECPRKETRSEVQAVCDRAAHLADVPTPVSAPEPSILKAFERSPRRVQETAVEHAADCGCTKCLHKVLTASNRGESL
jgi:hypothetical protein